MRKRAGRPNDKCGRGEPARQPRLRRALEQNRHLAHNSATRREHDRDRSVQYEQGRGIDACCERAVLPRSEGTNFAALRAKLITLSLRGCDQPLVKVGPKPSPSMTVVRTAAVFGSLVNR